MFAQTRVSNELKTCQKRAVLRNRFFGPFFEKASFLQKDNRWRIGQSEIFSKQIAGINTRATFSSRKSLRPVRQRCLFHRRQKSVVISLQIGLYVFFNKSVAEAKNRGHVGRSVFALKFGTTFGHFSPKVVFWCGTSAKSEGRQCRRPTRKRYFWDKVSEGSAKS